MGEKTARSLLFGCVGWAEWDGVMAEYLVKLAALKDLVLPNRQKAQNQALAGSCACERTLSRCRLVWWERGRFHATWSKASLAGPDTKIQGIYPKPCL